MVGCGKLVNVYHTHSGLLIRSLELADAESSVVQLRINPHKDNQLYAGFVAGQMAIWDYTVGVLINVPNANF